MGPIKEVSSYERFPGERQARADNTVDYLHLDGKVHMRLCSMADDWWARRSRMGFVSTRDEHGRQQCGKV